jgi:hypothetical protein
MGENIYLIAHMPYPFFDIQYIIFKLSINLLLLRADRNEVARGCRLLGQCFVQNLVDHFKFCSGAILYAHVNDGVEFNE